ncbi:hypothetical protein FACS189418_4410 [Clostridia bacterium]|nr:hypothetical protein FACS189418_4410 [Clostridia bacterium]
MKHKIKRYVFTLVLLCLVAVHPKIFALADGIAGNLNAWKRIDGTYRNTLGEPISGVVSRGIDISQWQGSVDWSKIAASDVNFVMFGLGRVHTPDPRFATNIQGAMRHNLKIGAYLFSIANNVQDAAAEAYYVLDQIKDYPISFPVAYDIEAGTGNLPKETVTDIIVTFCNIIQSAGYHPMVYANESVLYNKMDFTRIPWDIWVARYSHATSWDKPAMWQATSTYQMDGVTENTVDINFLFKDYSSLIAQDGWRLINGNWYYYVNYRQQFGWIKLGNTKYYLDANGIMKTGWMDDNGQTYYLTSGGAAAVGWRKIDNQWRYFTADGYLLRNQWIEYAGQKYRVDQDGIMLEGWYEENGKDYYFRPGGNGEAVTGWNFISGKWYYMQKSGEKTTGWIEDGSSYYLNTDGTMKTGWHNENNQVYYLRNSGAAAKGWLLINSTWYYFTEQGHRYSGWVLDQGKWYFLDQDGKMLVSNFVQEFPNQVTQSVTEPTQGSIVYYMTSTGAMTVDWQLIRGNWYYFAANGKMLTGWVWDQEKWYYLYPDGKMAENTTINDKGIDYTLGANGAWIS